MAPVPITVSTDPGVPPLVRRGEPVALGVAFARGRVPMSGHWQLLDPGAAPVPVQTTTLDRWGDGSVRWVLVEFQADVLPGAPSIYTLVPVAAMPVPPAGPVLAVEHVGARISVRTATATFLVPRTGECVLEGAGSDGGPLDLSTAIVAEDAAGRTHRFRIQHATVERAGPLSAVIRLDGAMGRPRPHEWLDVTVRLQFFAGHGSVRIDLSVTNPRAARHPGGLWDLGDPGSVLIRDLSIAVSFLAPGETDILGSCDRDERLQPAGDRFEVYQDSSGGAHWQHETHLDRDGQVRASFRGFRASRGGRRCDGDRATPLVSMVAGASRLSVTVPRFWELCPKSMRADARECAIGMFPRQHAGLHELQGGERATLTTVLALGPDTVSDAPLAWARSPLRLSADPAAYRRAGVWAPLTVGTSASHAVYDTLVARVVDAEDGFVARRATTDEFGWRHFGEMHADHESVGQAVPLVSHYNNQYDAIAGCATRCTATGDHRWWTLMDDLAAHVADIDLYHTTRDRAAYNGGHFWHTQHHASAGTATHRAYSRRSGQSGGGPSAEHNYTTGLMLHHFLTGSERSRAAVIQLATWVLDMDDGRKSRFRWIDRRETGLASGTRSPDFHGPGRGAGNSINALLDAHRLTGEPRYLDKADALIARCAHPADDPAAIDPLDAENKWSYTVFLQALGKYLAHRVDHGLEDGRYAYARAILLAYAAWMDAHERPYLETPDRLEHPTETWAAQDLRKAAVLEFAARVTDDAAARARWLSRAGGFVDAAIETLDRMPTARFTRPLVLLLAYGVQRPMEGTHAPSVTGVTLRPAGRVPFVPLRTRVVRKFVLVSAGLSAAALVAAVVVLCQEWVPR